MTEIQEGVDSPVDGAQVVEQQEIPADLLQVLLKDFSSSILLALDSREMLLWADREDYLDFRTNFRALKAFLAKTLNDSSTDSGGKGTDHLVWIYNHSKNEAFKRNLIRAIYELLLEEFARDFAPSDAEGQQFNKLIGLLDLVIAIGEKDPKFLAIYDLLKQKAMKKKAAKPSLEKQNPAKRKRGEKLESKVVDEDEEVETRYMYDAPALAHRNVERDIYKTLLMALSAVQAEDELQLFWMENVFHESDFDRLIVSVSACLQSTEDIMERRKQIPDLLAAFEWRKIGIDLSESQLSQLLRLIAQLAYSKDTRYFFDNVAGTLDFLRSGKLEQATDELKFDRYTSQRVRRMIVRNNEQAS